jgi:hypothetical protein
MRELAAREVAVLRVGEGRIPVMKLATVARIGLALALPTIVVLSVIPGSLRPHLLGNDASEHFVAYFVAGTLSALAYQRPMRLLSIGILLPICAGAMEFAQIWIPGRTPSAGDIAISTLGGWTAQLLVIFVRRFRSGQSRAIRASPPSPSAAAAPVARVPVRAAWEFDQ